MNKVIKKLERRNFLILSPTISKTFSPLDFQYIKEKSVEYLLLYLYILTMLDRLRGLQEALGSTPSTA